jgi:hypothetical protein
LLQNYAFLVPEESNHNLPCRWLCSKFFGFGDEEWRHSMLALFVSGMW